MILSAGAIIIITSICGIIYELLLSTLSSYLLGNSVLQFSITIGFFLLGLGIGSYISKFIKNYEKAFILTENLLALIGGLSMIITKWVYLYLIDYTLIFQIFYIIFVSVIGIFVGLEIPLIGIFLNQQYKNFQKTIGDLLSLDYIGSLIGTILFPIILLPWLGLTYTALAIGILNLIATAIFINISKLNIKQKIRFLLLVLIEIIALLSIGLYSVKNLENLWDHFFYGEPVIYSKHSQYQKIVITKRGNDIRLYLDGHLQFLSLDENRYHTSLTYFANKFINNFSGKKLNILILGGGDGLAVRNLLEYLSGKSFKCKITLVDLDPQITNLAKSFPLLVKLNKNSLNNKNVKIINEDAFKFLLHSKDKFNIIIADFPDPRNIELAKLYSKEFYSLIIKHLDKNGIFTTQASNSFFSKEAFWCIYKTIYQTAKNIKNRGTFKIVPHHTYIPSFGDWGFVSLLLGNNTKLLNKNYVALSGLINFSFDKDYIVNLKKIKINSIENPTIIKYYLQGYKRFSY